MISANAYLGADACSGSGAGADVVITGRVADPSLFVAPMIDRFGWGLDDKRPMATATLAGHLLECGTQVSGGYFADPGTRTCRTWPARTALGRHLGRRNDRNRQDRRQWRVCSTGAPSVSNSSTSWAIQARTSPLTSCWTCTECRYVRSAGTGCESPVRSAATARTT